MARLEGRDEWLDKWRSNEIPAVLAGQRVMVKFSVNRHLDCKNRIHDISRGIFNREGVVKRHLEGHA